MTTGDNTGDGTGGDTGGITPAVIALESVLATLREQLNVANGRAHRAEQIVSPTVV